MKPILVFQTDFTYKEGAVSAMYGVVKTVDRTLEIMDGTHELPRYDTWSASYRLLQTVRFWPKGTVFVSVVDPGVGTSRRSCVAKTADGYYIVTPDNGTLTHIAASHGIAKVRQIDETVNRLPATVGTSVFHGRDVFAYTAARFASGVIGYEEIGPEYPVEEIMRHPLISCSVQDGVVRGIFEIGDPNFGNLWTNIPYETFARAGFAYGDTLTLRVLHGDKLVRSFFAPFAPSFGFVEKGAPVIYTNELMRIGAALAQADLSERYGLGFGPDWTVEFSKRGEA
ncbi:MAG TPA: S-adenosyl-l-methionine hydroxide adenosyltransferase family protein [Feifaniaceae bacterium]|nr:S-adenosyl-l-methionine hydroxide adenosyltransferase family protein [Feifaniaceae bacterium]